MLCLQCGKEISEGAKFCPHCGAMTAGAAPGPAPAPGSAGGAGPYTYTYGPAPSAPSAPPAPPEDGGKRGKKGLIIGGAVAAVVVAVALIVALSGLFSSPKGQVEKAIVKTLAAAYADAGKGMGLPDMAELARSGSASQYFRVELNSVNSEMTGGYDLSALGGLGLRMSADCNREGRRLGGELAAFWGENEIVSFQMAAYDNILSFASPQFTKGDAYGMDTETLGADLVRLGVEDESFPVEEIGFNLFDLADETVAEQRNEEMERALKGAGKELAVAVKVDNAASVEMNGQLATGKDSLDLRLDEVILRAAGIRLCSLAVDYSVGPFDGVAVFHPDPKLLGDMDEDDLMELYDDIENNVLEWEYNLISLIPSGLLWAFLG